MKRIDVELQVMPWRGDRRVDPEFALATAIKYVIVNGQDLFFQEDYTAEPIIQGGATLHLNGFMTLQLDLLTDDSFRCLDVTKDDWLEGSTRSSLLLPVTSLFVTEASTEERNADLLMFPTT